MSVCFRFQGFDDFPLFVNINTLDLICASVFHILVSGCNKEFMNIFLSTLKFFLTLMGICRSFNNALDLVMEMYVSIE